MTQIYSISLITYRLSIAILMGSKVVHKTGVEGGHPSDIYSSLSNPPILETKHKNSLELYRDGIPMPQKNPAKLMTGFP